MRRLILVFFFICLLTNRAEGEKVLNIEVNSSLPMRSEVDIERIAIGSGKIAKVIQVPKSLREYLIVAQEAGTTSLFVWRMDGKREDYVVKVTAEDRGLAKEIEEAIGLPEVKVKKVDKRILLTGSVENQYERNYALQIARLYVGSKLESSLSVGSGPELKSSTSSPINGQSTTIQISSEKLEISEGEIIDLLEMKNPTQVRLEAQVIAIRPTDRQNLGIRYGNSPSESPGIFLFGES